MAAQPRGHLQLVEIDANGEFKKVDSKQLASLQAELEEVKTKFKMAQRDVAAKNLRINNLERDQAQERLSYERYADVQRIARYWHQKVHAGNARVNPMSPDRFDAVRGILDQERVVWDEPGDGRKRRRKRREPMYTLEECKAAIDGCVFDHFTKKRRNGSEQHFTDLEFIFRNSKNFEECRARCPYDYTALDLRPVTRDSSTGFQPTPSGQAGRRRFEGSGESYVQGHLGAGVGRLAPRVQGSGLLVRRWLGDGGPVPPAA